MYSYVYMNTKNLNNPFKVLSDNTTVKDATPQSSVSLCGTDSLKILPYVLSSLGLKVPNVEAFSLLWKVMLNLADWHAPINC